MVRVDWRYLQWPLVIFMAVALLSGLMAVGSDRYAASTQADYQRSSTGLRSTSSLYRNMIIDLDLLEQYRTQYDAFESSGLIGKEQRLNWAESLKSINRVLKLSTLSYNLLPQEPFVRPGFNARGSVEVTSAPMQLSAKIRHEEELFRVFALLRSSVASPLTVERCALNPLPSLTQPVRADVDNFSAKCTVRWVTINAQ